MSKPVSELAGILACHRSLTKSEQDEILARSAAGVSDDDRQRLLLSHIRFIVAMTTKRAGHLNPDDLLDVVSEVVLGAFRSLKYYDPSRSQPSTYLGLTVPQAISDALADRQSVKCMRLPRSAMLISRQLFNNNRDWAADGETVSQVAESLGIESSYANDIASYWRSVSCSFEDASPRSGHSGEVYDDFWIVDDRAIAVKDVRDLERMSELLESAIRELPTLTDKYRQVLLRVQRGELLVDIGKALGVSKQRVHQIVGRGVQMLSDYVQSSSEAVELREIYAEFYDRQSTYS